MPHCEAAPLERKPQHTQHVPEDATTRYLRNLATDKHNDVSFAPTVKYGDRDLEEDKNGGAWLYF
jgi:hypothetical protein